MDSLDLADIVFKTLFGTITHVVEFIMIPLRMILAPIDYFLSGLDGIELIPSTINSIVEFISPIPATLITLLGINPIIWNLFFIIFIAFISINPIISSIKRLLVWFKL